MKVGPLTKMRCPSPVILLRVTSVKFGLLLIDSKKGGTGIIGPEWLKELFEGQNEGCIAGLKRPGDCGY